MVLVVLVGPVDLAVLARCLARLLPGTSPSTSPCSSCSSTPCSPPSFAWFTCSATLPLLSRPASLSPALIVRPTQVASDVKLNNIPGYDEDVNDLEIYQALHNPAHGTPPPLPHFTDDM